MKCYLIFGLLLAVAVAQASTFNPDLNAQPAQVDPMKFVQMLVEEIDREIYAPQYNPQQLRKSEAAQTSNTKPTAVATSTISEDDEDLETFLLIVFVMFIVMVVVVAIAVRKQQRRLRNQQKRQQQQLTQNRSLPEQINFHYAEAHRLELLMHHQSQYQYAYPAALPYIEAQQPFHH